MKDAFVVFGEDWGGHPSSTQHLINHMLKEHRVIWVNSIGLRKPQCSIKDIKRVFTKLGAMLTSTKNKSDNVQIDTNLTIINPKAVSWPGSSWIQKLNGLLLSKQIKTVMKEQGIENPILWTSLPTANCVVGKLGEKKTIYYCCDDFSSLSGVDHQAVSKLENILVDKVDHLIVTSEKLTAKFNKQSILLEHGVDSELFSMADERPSDLPKGKPIAGFYGSISDWLDIELIFDAASERKDWDFVFIGKENVDVSSLKKLDNVFFLGVKPHTSLKNYVHHWDVSLLPFVDNAQIRACNPLKLREYLAAGTCIASTDFPALNPYKAAVDVFSSARELIDILNNQMNLDPLSKQYLADKRRFFVQSESWSNKANILLEQL